ncbi:MAG: hypothetical protein ACI83N_000570 [Hydrogenophaga sp.]|jgi:hypothetical protein
MGFPSQGVDERAAQHDAKKKAHHAEQAFSLSLCGAQGSSKKLESDPN